MTMSGTSDDEGPIYVRVEGYKDVLQNLEAVRQILENMGETVHVIRKLEDMKERSIETFIDNVEKLDERLEMIDREFPEVKNAGGPTGIREDRTQEQQPDFEPSGNNIVSESGEPKDTGTESVSTKEFVEESKGEKKQPQKDPKEEAVEESINDLHSELKGLKQELENL